MSVLQCEPIGYFFCSKTEKYMAAKQAELNQEDGGKIILNGQCSFEQALCDLVGFERIWLLFWFHRNSTWKPKVQTPRSGPKRGLFATRAPHRPNPIGLSCVALLRIEGREIFIGKNDLLDGTPILDIKPYLNYADAFPESRQGWIEEMDVVEKKHTVRWSSVALKQATWLEVHGKMNVMAAIELCLSNNPLPFPSHRIKKVSNNSYELAYKTWRVLYYIKNETVEIIKFFSGYDDETLQGKKTSRWDDVALHLQFLACENWNTDS